MTHSAGGLYYFYMLSTAVNKLASSNCFTLQSTQFILVPQKLQLEVVVVSNALDYM